MKKSLLILFFCFGFVAIGFAQETPEPPVFDYAKTKHELSLNIAPIIQGNYPFDLLYRKHYVNKNGKNVALRLGATVGANVGSIETTPANGYLQNQNGQSLNIMIGKEWQKAFHPRIIGYYGGDFFTGFGRYANTNTPNDPNQPVTNRTTTMVNVGGTGFLGMRYHLSRNFSISAETAAQVQYSHSSVNEESVGFDSQKITSGNLSLSMIPLRAIRFAFHF